MNSKTKKRLAVVSIVTLLAVYLLVDALHVFDDSPYLEVPHGSHSHFVPRDRDPNVPLENFPTVPPRPNEKIMPNGEVVPK